MFVPLKPQVNYIKMILKESWIFSMLVNYGKCYLWLKRFALFQSWITLSNTFFSSQNYILMEHSRRFLLNLVDTVVMLLNLSIGFWWPHRKRITVWTDTGHIFLSLNNNINLFLHKKRYSTIRLKQDYFIIFSETQSKSTQTGFYFCTSFCIWREIKVLRFFQVLNSIYV